MKGEGGQREAGCMHYILYSFPFIVPKINLLLLVSINVSTTGETPDDYICNHLQIYVVAKVIQH